MSDERPVDEPTPWVLVACAAAVVLGEAAWIALWWRLAVDAATMGAGSGGAR